MNDFLLALAKLTRLAMRGNSRSPLLVKLNALKPQLAAAAQKIYDDWDASDPDYGDWQVGGGGICHLIADAMLEIITDNIPDIVATTISSNHEVHVYVVVGQIHASNNAEEPFESEFYEIDIRPWLYEKGGGYSWTKIPDVVFDSEFITIEPTEPLELDENGNIVDY